MLRPWLILPLAALGSVLASCGGGSGPTGTDGTSDSPMMSREIQADPPFAVVQDIFERRCAGPSCHGAAMGGLFLGSDPEVNYDNLVNVPANAEPEFLRVEPGNATDSYIIIKTEGRQTVGAMMPLGGPPLDSIDHTNLVNWINNGAPPPR